MTYIEYIKPELLILIPVLYLIGMMIKSLRVKACIIPLTLGIVGIALACLWVFVSPVENIALALFTGVVQGVLCAGATVYGNQLWKQSQKED